MQPHLLLRGPREQPRGPLFHQEGGDPLLPHLRGDGSEYGIEIRLPAAGNKQLGAVQPVAPFHGGGRGAQGAGIGAGLGLGKGKGADLLSPGQPGKITLLLFRASVIKQRESPHGGMDGQNYARGGADPGNLFQQQNARHKVFSPAAPFPGHGKSQAAFPGQPLQIGPGILPAGGLQGFRQAPELLP